MQQFTVALAGNPNVGKTTIFNAVTGSRQHVGNWPGVTVEKKTGRISHRGIEIDVVDLPGTYSLTAYSLDEIVARDFILDEKPDVVIQVVDATNLERNLYLTTQLMEIGAPLVVALNVADLAEARGDAIDAERLQSLLAIPVVRTVGNRGEGIEDMLDAAIREAESPPRHEHTVGYGDDAEAAIARLVTALSADADLAGHYPLRWLAVRLLEGDEHADCRLEGSPAREAALEILAGIDREACEAALADKRYEVIAAILAQVCRLAPEKISASDRIDRVVTNRYLGIPIFLALMWGAFELTFAVGGFFGEAIEAGFGVLGEAAATIEPGWLASLIGDGILGGVGAVLAFVPHIFILFLILSIMEASGYLARAAFIMDRLMYAFGLPGKAFIPMLMGFGCNVPAIMATRTIEDHKERLITIMVNPFISCGARLPIYVLFTGIFFGREAGTVIFALYVLGIAVAIGSAKLFRSTILPGESAAFIMELPPYRLPTLRGSMIQMWDRGSTYLKKAGGIILIGAVIIWALASNPPGVEYGSQESLVGIIGNMLSPAVEPLGLNGKIAVALIFGILAKEIVVSSLGVLYGAGEDAGSLTDALAADPGLGPASALALMVFALLYLPCIATLAVIRAETGSWRWTGFAVGYGVVIAWLLAFFAYQAGRLIWGI